MRHSPTSARVLHLIVCAVAGLWLIPAIGCGGNATPVPPAPQRTELVAATPDTRAVVTEEQVKAASEEIVRVLQAKDFDGFNTLIDWSALAAAAADGLTFDHGAEEFPYDEFSRTLFRNITTGMAGGTRFEIINVRRQINGWECTARMIDDEGQFAYHQFQFHRNGERVQVCEWFMFILGEPLSAKLRAVYSEERAGTFGEIARTKNEAALAAMNGQLEVAKAKFDKIPPVARDDFASDLLRLQIAGGLRERAEFLAMLPAVRNKWPGNPATEFVAVQVLATFEDYDSVLESLDIIDEAAGGDPSMDIQRSYIYMALEENALAEQHAAQALAAEPDLRIAHDAAITTAANSQVADLFYQRLRQMGEKFNDPWPKLYESLELYLTPEMAGAPQLDDYLEFVWSKAGQQPTPPGTILREARANFTTKPVERDFLAPSYAQNPPADAYQVVKYPSSVGELPAYLTPPPVDGKKHPAVLWAHAGTEGVDASLWEVPETIDHGFLVPFTPPDMRLDSLREAGIVVMAPTYRGENQNPGQVELHFGEVDDLLAAREYLAGLPYVDPDRIYLIGQEEGGTLALVTATSGAEFAGVFSLEGVADFTAAAANTDFLPFDAENVEEVRLRSAIQFGDQIVSPTVVFARMGSTSHWSNLALSRRVSPGTPFRVIVLEVAKEDELRPPVIDYLAEFIQSGREMAHISPTLVGQIIERELRRGF